MTKTKNSPAKKQSTNRTRPVIWIVFGVLLMAGAWILGSQLMKSPDATTGEAPIELEVSVDEAASLREQGAFILDVRELSEWSGDGHISGATLIPLAELPNRLSELPKDKTIVVVCRSGNRSAQGRDILKNAGWVQVTSMAGGMKAWIAAGLDFVTGP